MAQTLLPSRDELIQAAKSGPDLLLQAQAYDPALAKRLQGEALVESKTLWGAGLTMAMGWLASRYALGWDPQFCALVAGLASLATHGAIHWLTDYPMIANPTPADAPLQGPGT